MLKEGVVLKDRYRVIGYVGSGGQRRVFRAIDTKGSQGARDVVIKEMFRGKSFKKDLVNAELTQQEVRILIDYPHPCIPRILDLFMDHGTYYLIQEFIEGKTLKEYIHDKKQLGETEALNLSMQMTEAVDYLHSQDPPIVIRDLKPSNVVVRHGRAFVVDLGGAQSDYTVGTDIENVSVSTRGYAPPEGVRARNAFTVDVFASGVMLHQMITGYDPVANPGTVPTIRRLKPDVHPFLEYIVNRATHWDYKRRYPSMLQFQLDLEKYQALRDKTPASGESIPAKIFRLWNWSVFPHVMLALILTLLALLLVGTVQPLPWLSTPHPPLLYVEIGVGVWALLVHVLWQHWFAAWPAANSLARKLFRKRGKARPIDMLVAVNLLLLIIFTVRLFQV